jgi:integration host factor subunit beta
VRSLVCEPRNAMTKADLINIVAKRLDITQVQSGIIVEAALKTIVSALQSGQEVEIRGFGSFRFRNRAPRKGRNPKTGEKVDVPPKRIPYFKMGKELKALLNGASAEEVADAAPVSSSGLAPGTEP